MGKKKGMADGDKAILTIAICSVLIYMVLKLSATPTGQAINDYLMQFIP